MTIRIIEQPDTHLTADEYQRYLAEYNRAFMMYAGTPPSFETWVRRQKGLPVLVG